MFDFVRRHNRVLQFLLVLLILPSFVLFGIQSYSKFASNEGVVAKVAGQKITQVEWDAAQRDAIQRVRDQQPDVDIAVFDRPEFRKQSLEALIRKYVLQAAAHDQNLSPPLARLVRVLLTDPQFAAVRNPDGSLNKQLLEARGMSSAQFEALLRQELTVGQVLGGVVGTGQPSKLADREAIEALFQVRDVQWVKFDPKNYLSQVNPTSDQLQSFYKDPANKSWLMSPEKAQVEYVVLDLDALKQRVSVSEDDLRRAYKENLARYTQPEERRASHILIKAGKDATPEQKKAARAKAESLLAELRKNPSLFAELAKKNSEDEGSASNGGDLDYFGRGAMVKPFEDAVFALKQGQISDVVQSDFGYHIIMLTGIRGGTAQPFEAVRSQIEDDARKQLAMRQYAEAAEKFTNMVYEQSDSLKPVADELKLPIQTMDDVLHFPNGKDQGVLGNKRVLDALFDVTNRTKGRNTEAIEVGPNKLLSARIVKYSPAALEPYDQVQGKVRERFIMSEALKLARKDAEAKLQDWKKSPDKAQLPASIQMSRRNVFNQPPVVLDTVLRVPESEMPAWRLVDLPGTDGVALVRVNKILPLTISPQELAETEAQFGPIWGKAEAEAYYQALKRKYKVEYFNDGKRIVEKVAEAQKSASAP